MLQTINLERGCSACMLGGTDKGTLFIMAAERGGTTGMTDGQRTGKVPTVGVSVPGAGWP